MKNSLFITLLLATFSAIPTLAQEATATEKTVDTPAAAAAEAPAATPAPNTQQGVKDPSLAPQQQTTDAQATTEQTPATPTAPETTVAPEAPERTATGVFMDVNVGTLGIGMNIGYEFNRYLKLRVRGSYLAADYEETWNEDSFESSPLNGKFEFDGSSFGILLDYHPFGGCFHLTGGFNISGMSLDAKATMENLDQYEGKYEFGDYIYEVNGLGRAQVRGRYEWNRVQPYLGIGWSSDGDGDRSIYFSCDIGVNFIGKGKLSVSHSGADISVTDRDGNPIYTNNIDAYLESSLREEGKDFFDIADKIIIYPVIQIGIGGRF